MEGRWKSVRHIWQGLENNECLMLIPREIKKEEDYVRLYVRKKNFGLTGV
jgi:hypothetical protein